MLAIHHLHRLALSFVLARLIAAAANAQPLGEEWLVNAYTDGNQLSPSAERAADGGFLVAWSSSGQLDGNDVFAQRYDADGDEIGSELLVNEYTIGNQNGVAIGMNAAGTTLFAWSVRRRGPRTPPVATRSRYISLR